MADPRSFRATQTYIWRSLDNLGNGAFGCVYKGYDKKNGKEVAIKAFNPKQFVSPQQIQQHLRELGILKSLDHPNITKLIAIENEMNSSTQSAVGGGGSLSGQVLIMELATGGSLYTLIEEPENNCGLNDVELLRVIAHLCEGLKYLREKEVLHRDVKPSNILKTVTDDGTILYKLCDFGAARVLPENEPFQSIVGTEEYLVGVILDYVTI